MLLTPNRKRSEYTQLPEPQPPIVRHPPQSQQSQMQSELAKSWFPSQLAINSTSSYNASSVQNRTTWQPSRASQQPRKSSSQDGFSCTTPASTQPAPVSPAPYKVWQASQVPSSSQSLSGLQTSRIPQTAETIQPEHSPTKGGKLQEPNLHEARKAQSSEPASSYDIQREQTSQALRIPESGCSSESDEPVTPHPWLTSSSAAPKSSVESPSASECKRIRSHTMFSEFSVSGN